MVVEYYGLTHVGYRRKENQDSICMVENDHHDVLAIVSDGIGGGRAGDVASKMAVSHLHDCFCHANSFTNDSDVRQWLKKTIQEANDLIFTQATRDIKQKGMGTTLVGTLLCAHETYIFNVGDSRMYGLYADDFLCLTEDHSYIADLLKKGEVSEEEAQHHPNRNVLTNALGIWNEVRIDICKIKRDFVSLLICSDGLHGYVEEQKIKAELETKKAVKDKVETLVQFALDAGGYDNVSVIVIEKDVSEDE